MIVCYELKMRSRGSTDIEVIFHLKWCNTCIVKDVIKNYEKCKKKRSCDQLITAEELFKYINATASIMCMIKIIMYKCMKYYKKKRCK